MRGSISSLRVLILSPSRLITIGLALLTGALCAQEAPRPNYITGRTVKSDGSPLAGVQLRAFGNTDAGQRSSLNTRSKADGTFSLRLPAGNFSLRAAVWPVIHEGRSYLLPLYLEGEDNEDFYSEDGYAARLVLKMEGKVTASKPDSDESAWFGGTIEIEPINSDRSSADAFPENATLTISLTPRSALLDGTPAKPLTYTRGLSWRRADRIILNVPLATYEATATLTVGGKQTRLTVASREGVSSAQFTELGQSAPIRFAPKSGEATLLSYGGVEKSVLQVVVPTRGQLASAPAAPTARPTNTNRPTTTNRPAPATPKTVAAEPDAGPEWKVGDHLDVLRTPRLDQWHAGTIIRTKPGLYLIKFDAFDDEFNEWVDASRLRLLDR